MRVLDPDKHYCPFCGFECDNDGELDAHVEYNHYDETYY